MLYHTDFINLSLKSCQIFKYNENKNNINKLYPTKVIKNFEIRLEWILSLKEDFNSFKIYMLLTLDVYLYSFKFLKFTFS